MECAARSSSSSGRGNNGRAAGRRVGVGQVRAGGGGGRRAGRRAVGLARGTGRIADASGPGKTKVGAGGDQEEAGGGARAHRAGTGRARGPGVGSPLRRPAARPSSELRGGTGRRQPTLGSGRRVTSARRARRAQPPPLLLSPGARAAPPYARPRLGRLGQRSSGCSLARPWLPRRPGSPPLPRGEPAGAGRRGETG